MSVDKWAYNPETCEGRACPGDCDLCDIPKNPEKYGAQTIELPDGFVETMNKLGELAGVGPDWWMLGPGDDFDEGDRIETKEGPVGVYAKREEDVEKLQAALEKLIEQEQREDKG